MKKLFLLPLLLTLALTAGCASNKLSLDHEALQNVKTVALVRVDEPVYRMINLGSPAAGLGAVGGVMVALEGNQVEKSLDGVLQASEFSFATELTAQLSEKLEKLGYDVKVIDVSRPDAGEFLEDYSSVDVSTADAVLDVVVTNAGYVTEHFMFSPEWRPEARVLVTLRSTSDNQAYYEETIMYGYHNPIMSGTDIDAPQEYMFKTKEDLFLSGDEIVVGGIQDAVHSIANHLTRQLAKQPL